MIAGNKSAPYCQFFRSVRVKDSSMRIFILFILFNSIFVNFVHGTDADIVGNYSDYGIDTNKNGLYEVLVVETGVQVECAGEYSIMGYLCGSNDEKIWSIDHGNLSRGYHVMHLFFGGKSIHKKKLSGKFRISDLSLMPGSSDTKLSICDYIQNAYVTSMYNYSEFDS